MEKLIFEDYPKLKTGDVINQVDTDSFEDISMAFREEHIIWNDPFDLKFQCEFGQIIHDISVSRLMTATDLISKPVRIIYVHMIYEYNNSSTQQEYLGANIVIWLKLVVTSFVFCFIHTLP